MHDIKFSQEIINAIKKEISRPGSKISPKRITVNVRLSTIGHVKPEGLKETFRQLAAAEGFDNVKLVVKPLEIEVKCRDCGCLTMHSKPVLACPECGSGNFNIDSLKEFLIESIL